VRSGRRQRRDAVDFENQAMVGSLDARFLLEGQGRKTGGGVVFGNQN